jgi:hypothetical protein
MKPILFKNTVIEHLIYNITVTWMSFLLYVVINFCVTYILRQGREPSASDITLLSVAISLAATITIVYDTLSKYSPQDNNDANLNNTSVESMV